MEKRIQDPSETGNKNSEDQNILSHKKQRFTLSSLEIIFGSLIVLGLIYIGYIIFFQESSGPSSRLEKKVISLETNIREQNEKIDQRLKAIQDGQTQWESRIKALETANQNLTAKVGKTEPQKAEEKKLPPATPAKRKIQYMVKKGDTLRSIAIKYKVSTNDLLQWNKRSKNKPVKAGDTLIIIPR